MLAALGGDSDPLVIGVQFATSARRWPVRVIRCPKSSTLISILKYTADITTCLGVYINGIQQDLDRDLSSLNLSGENVSGTPRTLADSLGGGSSTVSGADSPLDDDSQSHSPSSHWSPSEVTTPTFQQALTPSSMMEQLVGAPPELAAFLIIFALPLDVKDCPCIGCGHLLLKRSSRRACDCCNIDGRRVGPCRVMCVPNHNSVWTDALGKLEYWGFAHGSDPDATTDVKLLGNPEIVKNLSVLKECTLVLFASERDLLTAYHDAERISATHNVPGPFLLNVDQFECRIRMISHFWKLSVQPVLPNRTLGRAVLFPKLSKVKHSRNGSATSHPDPAFVVTDLTGPSSGAILSTTLDSTVQDQAGSLPPPLPALPNFSGIRSSQPSSTTGPVVAMGLGMTVTQRA